MTKTLLIIGLLIGMSGAALGASCGSLTINPKTRQLDCIGAGTSGTVTSVQISGTANQITATSCGPSTTTLACVLSTPADFRLPGTINLLTLTQPATAATLTLANNSTLATVGAFTSTFTFTGATGVTFPTSGTLLTSVTLPATVVQTNQVNTFGNVLQTFGAAGFTSPVIIDSGCPTANQIWYTVSASGPVGCGAGFTYSPNAPQVTSVNSNNNVVTWQINSATQGYAAVGFNNISGYEQGAFGNGNTWGSIIGATKFAGSGLSTITFGGTYSGSNQTLTYCVKLTATDHFSWGTYSYPAAENCVNGSASVSITGSGQTLSNGVTVTFGSTTGYTIADKALSPLTTAFRRKNYLEASCGVTAGDTGCTDQNAGQSGIRWVNTIADGTGPLAAGAYARMDANLDGTITLWQPYTKRYDGAVETAGIPTLQFVGGAFATAERILFNGVTDDTTSATQFIDARARSISIGAATSNANTLGNALYVTGNRIKVDAILNGNSVTITNASHTGSDQTTDFNLQGTWNTSGAPTAFLMNIGDTASSANSLLADFQVTNSSKWKVTKGGSTTQAGFIQLGTDLYVAWGSHGTFQTTADGVWNVRNNTQTAGEVLDFSTDGVLKLRNRANNADAALTASNGTFSGASSAALYATATKCANGASPAVCAAAPGGAVAIPTGVTTVALTVNTTAVTASSQIKLTPDDTVTIGGVTCNNVLATLTGGLAVTGRVAGTSFTVTYNGTIATNPLCVTYEIQN